MADPLSIEFQQTGMKADALAPLLDACAAALFETGEAIMADSKENYCPVAPDGGTLRGSGHVTPVERTSDGQLQTMLVYGGPASDYAIAVHEHLSSHSPYSWKVAEERGDGVHFNVGGPKFLELPVLAAQSTFGDNIATGTSERTGGNS